MTVPVPDLRRAPPRRWNAAVDGVIWLPRFADKARAHAAGTLGPYLYGQSPIDAAFLGAARLDYAEFTAIVMAGGTDAEVLAAVERMRPGARERLRRWSVRFPRRPVAAVFFRVIDLDDGYLDNAPLARVLRAVTNRLAVPVVALMRALPSKS